MNVSSISHELWLSLSSTDLNTTVRWVMFRVWPCCVVCSEVMAVLRNISLYTDISNHDRRSSRPTTLAMYVCKPNLSMHEFCTNPIYIFLYHRGCFQLNVCVPHLCLFLWFGNIIAPLAQYHFQFCHFRIVFKYLRLCKHSVEHGWEIMGLFIEVMFQCLVFMKEAKRTSWSTHHIYQCAKKNQLIK